MRTFIIRRLIQAVGILFVLSVVVFLLLRVAPGAKPWQIKCGLSCTEEIRAALKEEMGGNEPYFPVSLEKSPPFVGFHRDNQYGRWISNIVSGSLGKDWNGLPVGPELKRRIPTTIEILIITSIVGTLIGVPFGIISAIFRNSPADYGVRFGAVLGLAVPNFLLAVLVLQLPQVWWDYAPTLTHTISFPSDPVGNLKQIVPPALVLAALEAAGIMRLTRSSMLEVMRQDYIRTARSKGLRERMIIARHALKNSMIPVITVLGLQIAGLFGGAVIVEQVFNLNGVGSYFFGALIRKDFEVVQTLTLYVGIIVVLMNLLVDISYAWLDPRIRYS